MASASKNVKWYTKVWNWLGRVKNKILCQNPPREQTLVVPITAAEAKSFLVVTLDKAEKKADPEPASSTRVFTHSNRYTITVTSDSSSSSGSNRLSSSQSHTPPSPASHLSNRSTDSKNNRSSNSKNSPSTSALTVPGLEPPSSSPRKHRHLLSHRRQQSIDADTGENEQSSTAKAVTSLDLSKVEMVSGDLDLGRKITVPVSDTALVLGGTVIEKSMPPAPAKIENQTDPVLSEAKKIREAVKEKVARGSFKTFKKENQDQPKHQGNGNDTPRMSFISVATRGEWTPSDDQQARDAGIHAEREAELYRAKKWRAGHSVPRKQIPTLGINNIPDKKLKKTPPLTCRGGVREIFSQGIRAVSEWPNAEAGIETPNTEAGKEKEKLSSRRQASQ